MATLFKYGFFLKDFSNINLPSTLDPSDPSGILSKSIPSNAIEQLTLQYGNDTSYHTSFSNKYIAGVDIVHGTWPTMLPACRITTACKS